MCEQQEAILSDASNIFDEIDDMRRLQVKALRGHDVAELLRLDKELETLFGKEERAFGALRQHRRDHGC